MDVEERKTVRLTPANLGALVEDMGILPGVHPAGDLYKWYVGMCREVGAEPITKKSFGVSLKNQGYANVVARIAGKNTRCWMLTRRAFRDPRAAAPQFSPDSRQPTLANPDDDPWE